MVDLIIIRKRHIFKEDVHVADSKHSVDAGACLFGDAVHKDLELTRSFHLPFRTSATCPLIRCYYTDTDVQRYSDKCDIFKISTQLCISTISGVRPVVRQGF